MNFLHTIGRRWRWGVAVAVATAVGVAVAGQGNAATAAEAKPFSAVELSDAILFNTGPAAPNLASLQRGPVPWTDAMKASQAAIDEAVSADPRWAATFQREVQSGDPNQIEVGLSSLAELSYAVLTKRFGTDAVLQAVATVGSQIDKQHLILGQDLSSEFANYAGDTVWVDNDVVLYGEIAVAVVAVAVAVIVVEKQLDPEALEQVQLAKELLVRAIATELPAAVG
jgi:hypothetical protein